MLEQMRQSDAPPEHLVSVLGGEKTRTIDALMRETGRVALAGVRRAAEGEAQTEIPSDTLSSTAMYMAEPRLPPELKQALLGRDLAQLALIAVLNAAAWALGRPQIEHLADIVIAGQGKWYCRPVQTGRRRIPCANGCSRLLVAHDASSDRPE
ncbi:MAG: hypothetical protein HYV09_29380 [Deltaproteobacteria bacterium]|nr:hypothetical protein [Deltaproteobacteria bacterium]